MRLARSTAVVPARGEWLGTSVVAAAAGLGTWFAFPPHSLWWAALPGVAALAVTARGRGIWRGAWTGLVWGAGLFLPLLHFTEVAMGNAIGWAALTIMESLYLAGLGLLWAAASRLPALTAGRLSALWRVLAFTLLWCGVEQLRSTWPFGGFPFGRLAFAMADSTLLPVASYGGSLGLSAAVALAAGVVAEAWRSFRANAVLPALVATVLAGAVVLAPVALPVPSETEDGTIRVGAVQGSAAKSAAAYDRALEVTSNHSLATQELAQRVGKGTLDVVIWPEDSADRDPRTDTAAAALVATAADAVGAPVLVGAVPYVGRIRYNDELIWTPGSGAGAYYRKHRPVPFGEYIPMRSLIRKATTQVDRIGVDMLPGTGSHVLAVRTAVTHRTVRLAMGICFEVAYDDELRAGIVEGGQAIVIPTNNASFLDSGEAAQQLAQGRVQAVVHGRSVVQVSTVGITAIISPKGVVEQQTKPYTRASLVADVGLRRSRTVADSLGPWPGIVTELVAAGLALTGIVAVGRGRRSRRRA